MSLLYVASRMIIWTVALLVIEFTFITRINFINKISGDKNNIKSDDSCLR